MERMKRYMLDTNTVSHLVKKHPKVSRKIVSVPMGSVCISAITEGELLFGLAKRPEAVRLKQAVIELLRRVDVLCWDSAAAQRYGIIRANQQRSGKALAALDLLIASHAAATDATLLTSDNAFSYVEGLSIEDWTN
jgi:tRNA(fMet)-specific endonuclease VapC